LIGFFKKLKGGDLFETLGHARNYFLADLSNKAIGFISIPILTRILTEEEYGLLAVFSAYAGILTIILSFNLTTSVERYYFEEKDDFKEFLGGTFLVVNAIFIACAAVYLFLYRPLTDLMALPTLLPLLLLVLCYSSIISQIYDHLLIAQKRSRERAIIVVFKGYAGFFLGLALALYLATDKYMGFIWGLLIISGLMSTYFLINIIRSSNLVIKKNHVVYMAGFSIPLIPFALAGIINAQFDRIMIHGMVSTAKAGLYSLGYNIGMLLMIAILAVTMAMRPDFYRFMKNGEYKRIDDLTAKLFGVVTVVSLGLIFFATELVIILADSDFKEALDVVPLVVLGYLFYGMFLIYARYLNYIKKTYLISITVVFTAAINVVLNYLLIPPYGYMVAAYTTIVSYFLMFILIWLVAKMVVKEPLTPVWAVWKPTMLMFGFVAMAYSFIHIDTLTPISEDLILFFFVKLALLGAYIYIVLKGQIRAVMGMLFRAGGDSGGVGGTSISGDDGSIDSVSGENGKHDDEKKKGSSDQKGPLVHEKKRINRLRKKR